jgi:HK97 family phage portal protein
MFDRLQERLARGLKAFQFPVGSGGGVPGALAPWLTGLFPLLPGTRFDYKKEAGTLWLSSPVLAAIQWLCRTWSEAPSVVRRSGKAGALEPVRPHPLTDLLETPNPYYDASVLWMGTLLSWVVDGNAYWYVERGGGNQPVGLLYIPHYLIAPIGTKTEFRTGYTYRVDGDTLQLGLDEVIHFQNGLDPSNMRRGLSPLAAEFRSIVTDNEAQGYAAALLRNMGVPGVVISPKSADMDLPPDQGRALKELWRGAVTGDNRGQPVVPSFPVEIQNPGFSPEQLALDKLAAISIPRICAAIGVDPMVLGLPSDTKTYSNLREAREGTYEQTLIPMQRTFDSQLARQIRNRLPGFLPGDVLGRDYDSVRALQDDMDKLFARQTRAVGGPWITVDEARSKIGLDPIPGGDVLYPQSGGGFGGGAPGEALPRAAGIYPETARRWRERRERAERAGTNGH